MLGDVVDFLARVLLVLNIHLLLENLVDFLQKVGLPAKQLYRLDVVERFVDEKVPLLALASQLLVDRGLSFALDILDKHASQREKDHDEAAPADLSEHDVAPSDQMEGNQKVLRTLPDEVPYPIRLVVDYGVDLCRAEVFVRRACHPEVFAIEHRFESSVCQMAHLGHLERKILPNSVLDHAQER